MIRLGIHQAWIAVNCPRAEDDEECPRCGDDRCLVPHVDRVVWALLRALAGIEGTPPPAPDVLVVDLEALAARARTRCNRRP